MARLREKARALAKSRELCDEAARGFVYAYTYMCAGELSLVRSALPPALLAACWCFLGLGWGFVFLACWPGVAGGLVGGGRLGGRLVRSVDCLALLGWGWLLGAARLYPSVGCGLQYSLARFREHPSNLMDVRCSQLWGRFSQLGMWGQGVICEAEPRSALCMPY